MYSHVYYNNHQIIITTCYVLICYVMSIVPIAKTNQRLLYNFIDPAPNIPNE